MISWGLFLTAALMLSLQSKLPNPAEKKGGFNGDPLVVGAAVVDAGENDLMEGW